MRQRGGCIEEPLLRVELGLALDADERLGPASARGVPAARKLGGVVRQVADRGDNEPCGAEEPLVFTRWREQEVTDRRACRELLERDETGDDDRIGEEAA